MASVLIGHYDGHRMDIEAKLRALSAPPRGSG